MIPPKNIPTVISLFFAVVMMAATVIAGAGGGTLRGTATALGANGEALNVTGAIVKLTNVITGSDTVSTTTNDDGEFKFANLNPGLYTLEITANGFAVQSRRVTIRPDQTTVEDFRLEIEVVKTNVTVNTQSDEVEKREAAPASTIAQKTLQTVPLVNERFQDALPLIPGVVRGPDGLLNVKGARASQSGLTVNSANVTDPVTGEFAINLPIEAIQSVQVLTNPYASEYGEFTGAVTSIETKSGTDKFDTEFQNFFPRIRRRDGHYVGIEAFTPRLAFSGPIKKDKLWFMQSFEYRYVRTPVESLPPLERDTNLESFDSVSQIDWQVRDQDHVTTTFSLFPQKLTYVNLNTFNPQPVTPDFRQHGFFWAVNERHVLSGKSLLETLFSVKRFDANVYPSSGPGVMNFAPDTNSGSFFNQQQRNTNRYELVENFSFAPGDFLGAHSMKVGGGFNYSDYDGINRSTEARILRADGTRSRQIDFVGSGIIGINKSQGLAYFQDKWDVNSRLSLEYGVRYDRDNLASENNLAPRFAFSFLPIADGRTVIRGGIGLFYDQIELNVASFQQLQQRVITFYAADGQQIIRGPLLQNLILQNDEFEVPRSINWNLEFDREWSKNLIVRVGYEQRSGNREFVLDPLRASFSSSTLLLSNSGLSRYRELHVTTRYHTNTGNELVASYIRSSAHGDVNDVNSYFGNFENPIIHANQRAPLNFDSPNRLILWGSFNVKWGVTVAPVFDVREGFPYSVIDQDRNFVGPRNSQRFPTFAALDLQVMKSFPLPNKLEKYRIRGGVKLFNITDHFNPRDVQNNIDSANFGTFYNGVGRMFAFKFAIEKK
jgi:hypothetical protein